MQFPKFLQILMRLGGIAGLVLAVVFGGCCVGFYEHSKGLLSDDLPAVGTVTGNFVSQASDNSGPMYYPQISFKTADGSSHSFQSTSGSRPADYTVGQQVALLYPAQHPDQVMLNTFSSLWLLPLLMGLAAVFCLLVGAGLWWLQRKLARDERPVTA